MAEGACPIALGKSKEKDSSQPSKKGGSCPVCLDKVEDPAGKRKGHKAIFCDGVCQDWIHRQCAGLSKAAFSKLSKSDCDIPFHCPKCIIISQSKELSTLRASVSSLEKEILSLKVPEHVVLTNSTCADDLSSTTNHSKQDLVPCPLLPTAPKSTGSQHR